MCESISLRNTIITEEEAMNLEGVGRDMGRVRERRGRGNDTNMVHSCAKAQ